MIIQALAFKSIIMRYEPRKIVKLEPLHFTQLVIFIQFYDRLGYMVTVSAVFKECVSFGYISSLMECYSGFNILYSKHLVKRREYGTKGRFKYMPSAQGRLFITDFWQYYEAECKRLNNNQP